MSKSVFHEIIVDNFAGGGGASTGIEIATGRSVDIAINHDPAAIAMHRANHPKTKHYCENVWDVDPVEACAGRKVALAWFSPDCKHFSKAKGGKPVEKHIRGLAWVAVKWAKLVRPRVIMLENVEEFTTWGPLTSENKPDKRFKGRTFRRFVHALKRYGYCVEWRELRACDYGAPTTRKRFFLIARCDGLPIVWPEPTHGDPESLAVHSGYEKPWRTAAALADELDETVSEEVPVPETKEIVTKPGDIWILGRHRVMCGDCTNKDHREKLLDGATPQILLTDPPYCSGGFQESGRSSGSIGTITKYKYEKRTPTIANDMLSTRGYQALIKQAITGIPCAVAYIFTDWRMWLYLFDLVEGSGFGVRSMIVWNKKAIGMGSGWRSQHELIMFAHRTKTKFDNTKGYGNVLECSRSGNDLHPTQKPVELIEMLLDNTDWCNGVYDPFGGSGTTLIACEKMGQTAYIMELEPKYVDTIVRRFAFVNKKKKMKCIRNNKSLSQEEIAPILADLDEVTEE